MENYYPLCISNQRSESQWPVASMLLFFLFVFVVVVVFFYMIFSVGGGRRWEEAWGFLLIFCYDQVCVLMVQLSRAPDISVVKL